MKKIKLEPGQKVSFEDGYLLIEETTIEVETNKPETYQDVLDRLKGRECWYVGYNDIWIDTFDGINDKGFLPTEKLAKQIEALIKTHNIAFDANGCEVVRKGWYIACNANKNFLVCAIAPIPKFDRPIFKTKELAEKAMENHREIFRISLNLI